MKPVFLDTVGLIALWNSSDQWHQAAEQAFSGLLARRQSFATTTFVLLECGNAAARRPFRGQLCRLRETLERRNELITPTEADWQVAWSERLRIHLLLEV